ncbi:MAG: hypothetical protein KAS32_10020 [Candidatus Peribacteraceae bacterium]|nr:hypothetical protein [Candidatus Peribacteraceae bacterium]
MPNEDNATPNLNAWENANFETTEAIQENPNENAFTHLRPDEEARIVATPTYPRRDWKHVGNTITFFILGDIVGYTYSHWSDYEKSRRINNRNIVEILPPGKTALELQEYGALKLCKIFGKGMTLTGHVLTSREALKIIKSRTEFTRVKGRRDETSILKPGG